jgi:hypothetical protein
MAESKQLAVACICGAASHKFIVPASSLPMPTHLCSCDISRRISGSLLTSYVNITHDFDAPRPDLSALTPYPSSDILTRHFCSTCGTHMYLEYKHDGHFEVATGSLQGDSTDGVIEYKAHVWVEDTPDGGASRFITDVNGRQLKRYSQEPGGSEEASSDAPPMILTKDAVQAPIHAHCHCKGVQFYIQPPNEASRTAESPYPDLLVPYHTGSSANPQNHPWWLATSNRYLAGTCACTSCRKASGFDITFWAFIPTVNITLDAAGREPFTRKQYWGSMKTYRSSSNVTRTFCGVCGANIFWDGDERPSIVDVAVGLLDAGDGARAERLLSWWPDRVSFEEDALNMGLIKGLRDGLKDWAGRTLQNDKDALIECTAVS